MYPRVIGIDPGLDGAVAALDVGGEFAHLEPLAGFKPDTILHLCRGFSALVVIEKAQAMPKQGVSSMFTYGTGYGRLIGWCEAHNLPHMLVTPHQWTKAMHTGACGADAKARSLDTVTRLYPTVELCARFGKKKPHRGVIDAMLIATWGMRHASPPPENAA